jgi:catechol 2,3-dioxygenase-like lactoylglutathione lyase family enzyme
MNRKIALISLIVKDYDEAINFYTNVLDFNLIEDTKISEEKRWVVIQASEGDSCSLLLAKASDEEQEKSIGNQTGGRVFLFLNTDNFQRDYTNFKNKGVNFVREPLTEEYGTVAVFEDLYGNLWDLIERTKK